MRSSSIVPLRVPFLRHVPAILPFVEAPGIQQIQPMKSKPPYSNPPAPSSESAAFPADLEMTAVSRMLTTKYMGKRQKDLEGFDWRVDPRIPGPAPYKAPQRLDAGRTSGVRGRWGTSQPAKQGSSRGGPREPGGCTAPRAAMQCVLLLPIPQWRLVEALGVCRWGS